MSLSMLHSSLLFLPSFKDTHPTQKRLFSHHFPPKKVFLQGSAELTVSHSLIATAKLEE